MMTLAVRLAKRGLGTTAPNPSVGAVVARPDTGEIVSVGFTQPGGRPHAEDEALRDAGPRARGATLYVTLEPCAHTGRVPTCSDQVISAGLARVVAALPDPNPVIAGRGFEQLRAHGLVVEVGLGQEPAFALTRGHITRQTFKRPSVLLKLATSADGRIALGDGAPRWVTGPEARARGHLMRAEADAMIVGIKTIFADDPELTCRLPGLAHRSPQRIVIDNRLRLPTKAKVLRPNRAKRETLVATCASAESAQALVLKQHGADVLGGLGVVSADGREMVDLTRLLQMLGHRGVTRVLLEGGPTLARNFIDADLVDEFAWFQSATELAALGAMAIDADLARALQDGMHWRQVDTLAFGRDRLRRFERTRGA